MTDPITLQSIAINSPSFGISDVVEKIRSDDFRSAYREGEDHDLMIEFTDPTTGSDHLIELIGVKTIQRQVRPSLYQHEQGGGRDPQKNTQELERTQRDRDIYKRRHAEAESLLNVEKASVRGLRKEVEELQTELARVKESKVVNSVEVWTYDEEGFVSTHYVLTVDDVDEEIPVGNVVISLRREEA